MATPPEILNAAYERARGSIGKPIVDNPQVLERIRYVSRLPDNRAGVRVVLSCALAKTHRPNVDIRKPYTEIASPDSFSGRHYDEAFITSFINAHRLPCNSTTAYLTPALRNIDYPLTTEVNIVGRPKKLYVETLKVLDDVYQGRISAEDLLTETVRQLILLGDEQSNDLKKLLANIERDNGLAISAEGIVNLVSQHLSLPKASRLPVLVVAAAYNAAEKCLGERVLPLESHNAADVATGCLGDLEITLLDDDGVVTAYEMKDKRVTIDDINHALSKIAEGKHEVDNYIFITTEVIEPQVAAYAASTYDQIGVELVVLDCIGFLRHYLHLFHRLRMQFLEEYQKLVLAEPDSCVSHALKQAFLALRQAATAV